jgi:hypothetical protein
VLGLVSRSAGSNIPAAQYHGSTVFWATARGNGIEPSPSHLGRTTPCSEAGYHPIGVDPTHRLKQTNRFQTTRNQTGDDCWL